MDRINYFITELFSLILSPLATFNPAFGLLALSVIAGVILALAYGAISNQGALKKVKRRIVAGIYESVLFRHDLRASLKAQAGMLLSGARYFSIAIPPILILLIPSLILLAQLNLRYGHRPLIGGESTVLNVKLRDEAALFETELKTPTGITATPPVRDLEQLLVSWRIDTPPGERANTMLEPLTLSVSGKSAKQPLYDETTNALVQGEIHSAWWWRFLYPGASVPSELRGDIEAISLVYPEQTLALSAINFHWITIFGLVSICAGLVASKVRGIEI